MYFIQAAEGHSPSPNDWVTLFSEEQADRAEDIAKRIHDGLESRGDDYSARAVSFARLEREGGLRAVRIAMDQAAEGTWIALVSLVKSRMDEKMTKSGSEPADG